MKNYDMGKKSDMKRFRKNFKSDILGYFSEELCKEEHDYECDFCGKQVTVRVGKNVCPFCGGEITVTLPEGF